MTTRHHRALHPARIPFALLAAVLFFVAAALSFWPLLTGKIPLAIDIVLGSPVFESIRHTVDVNLNHADLGDLVAGFYSVHGYSGAAVRAGVLPLWNPHLLLGQPFLAIYQSAVLYPPNLLYFVLPTAVAWALLFPLRIALAGLFCALFARAIGASKTGALVAGLAYAYSGFMITWSGWPHVDVAVWLPAICLAIHKLRQDPGPRRAALVAVCVSMALLGGHPQTVLYVIAFSAVFGLHRVLGPTVENSPNGEKNTAGRGRTFVWLAVGGVLGGALAAIQLLPTAEWLSLLHRNLDDDFGTYLYRNNIFLFLSRDTRGTPNSAGLLIPEAAAYVGILPLLAAVLSLLHRARRDIVLLWTTVIFAGLVAYGVPPVFDFVVGLPVLKGLPNWRLLVLAEFAIAVLAGLGITAIQQKAAAGKLQRDANATRLQWQRPVVRTRVWWLLLGVWGFVLYRSIDHLQFLTDEPIAGRGEVVAWRGPGSSLLFLVVSLLLLSPLVMRRLPVALISVLLLGVVGVDLLSYSYGHNPFIERSGAYPRPHLFDELEERDPGLYRVAAVDSVYPKNIELAYGMDAPGGTGYQVRAIDPLLNNFGEGKSGYELRSKGMIANRDRRLDLLNVKYFFTSEHNDSARALAQYPQDFKLVLTEINAKVYENIGVLPRSFVVPYGGATYVDEVDEGYEFIARKDFAPERQVVVVGEPPISVRTPDIPRTYVPAAKIEVSPNAVDIALHPETEGILVLSDTWYPGWEVEVDGGPRPLLRVDGALKGVAVKAGDQQVHFEYRPRSFKVGALISGAGVLTLVALLYLGAGPRVPLAVRASRLRRRRPAAEPSVE